MTWTRTLAVTHGSVARTVLLRGVGVVLSALLLTACGGHDQPDAAPPEPGALRMEADSPVRAGHPVVVDVVADNSINATLQVAVESSAGFALHPVELLHGRGQLVLADDVSNFTGVIALDAQLGDATATIAVEIVPGPPVDPLTPLVGPRSIVADGNHWTMLVAIPQDSQGNPVADGTPLQIHLRHPTPNTSSQPIDTITTDVQHMLAWERIFSGTTAGDLLLAVTAGAAHGPERTVREVPGPPAAIAIHVDSPDLPADGRQLLTLATEPLVDQFGNQLLDGTAVQFLVADDTGAHRALPAVTVDGRAATTMQSPTRAGTLTVTALTADVVSPPVTLSFAAGPAVEPIMVDVIYGDDVVELRAGPLVGPLGQFVPDGTEVAFTLVNHDDLTIETTAVADGGYASALVRTASLKPGVISVTVAAGTGTGDTSFRVR